MKDKKYIENTKTAETTFICPICKKRKLLNDKTDEGCGDCGYEEYFCEGGKCIDEY